MYNPRQNSLYIKLRKIFNKYDLMYMWELGAPKDEYYPEIDRIIPFISNKTINELVKLIEAVFNKMFHSGCVSKRKNEIVKMAEDINAMLETTSYDEKYWRDFYSFNEEFRFYIKENYPEKFLKELKQLTKLCVSSKILRGDCFVKHNHMLLQYELLQKSSELQNNVHYNEFLQIVSGYSKQVQLKFEKPHGILLSPSRE